MIRQKDVAHACEVSQATVSRALKDDVRIAPEVRKRIKRVAHEMGYTLSPALQTLSLHRWSPGSISRPNIGVILANPNDRSCRTRATFMRERAAELGYHASVFALSDYRRPENLRRALRARGVQGLIFDLWTARCGPPEIWAEFSCISVGSRFVPCPFDSVVFDHYLTLRSLLEAVVARGYRRIAVALLSTPSRRDNDLRTGAIEGMRQRVPPDRATVLPTLYLPDDYSEGRKELDTLVKKHRPDVVIGFNRFVLDMLKDNGVKVPERVAFVALHNREEDPSIASPIYNEHALSVAGVERLALLVQSGRRGLPEFPCTIQVAMHELHAWNKLPMKAS